VTINTNRWNRLRYTLWAPIYDVVGRRFDRQRQESLRILNPLPGERILIVGAGTGADLQHRPPGARVVATDLTLAMLERARPRAREGTYLTVMDGHQLAVRTASFDAVVLHLILAVIPDPVRCLQEAARALRPGGRMVVFDKFVRGRPPAVLRVLNVATSALFTDVTRSFEDILHRSNAPLTLEQESPALFGGLFRHLLLRKSGLDQGLV
jgi:phosphatidylethanolamine/phosphatidyl-N-methylethanolamine N-methyltransferase